MNYGSFFDERVCVLWLCAKLIAGIGIDRFLSIISVNIKAVHVDLGMLISNLQLPLQKISPPPTF